MYQTHSTNFHFNIAAVFIGMGSRIVSFIIAEKSSVTVNFDYIKELDKDGNEVGATGKKKHSINSFARESFSFKTSGMKTEYQNISVKHTQFEATISGPGAKLIVDIFIFKGSGNLSTSNDESLEVKKGDIKFNIKLESWTFCGGSGGDSCSKGASSEAGTQVEFGIEIKGRSKPTKRSKAKGKGRKLETLDLGGADCTLSGAVSRIYFFGPVPVTILAKDVVFLQKIYSMMLHKDSRKRELILERFLKYLI